MKTKNSSVPETIYSLNGSIVPETEAVVPVTDRGFLYGDGVFETLHAYGAHIFRLREHLERMERGFEAMAFARPPGRKQLAQWAKEAVREGGYPESNVRVTVTRGSGPRGPSIRGSFRPLVVIMVSRFQRRPARDYTEGVNAILASFRRQESSVVATLKTTAYVEQIYARREADAAHADEALMLNNAGLLCEGSASNITLVREGRLVAPHPRIVGALPGTMQLIAFELAARLKIPVQYVGLGPWDLRACEEAFLSGSLREITPLVKVGDQPVGSGRPGPITLKLIQAYRALVERECAGYRFAQS